MNPLQRSIAKLVGLLIPLLLAGGCITVPRLTPATVPTLPENSTYLLHISGVSGVSVFDAWWLDQLQAVAATDRWEIYDWMGGRHIFQALRAIDENRRIAGDVASYLTAVHRANPRVRLVLTSESAGTALAVWTLEQLPPDVKVENALLVAPDLSPNYDLSKALAHVNRHLIYTTSILDFGTLGIWTRALGNMDGVKSAGAGFVGFRAPAGASASAYERLQRVRWNILAVPTANFGNHSGGLAMLYGRFVLGPILLKDAESIADNQRDPNAR